MHAIIAVATIDLDLTCSLKNTVGPWRLFASLVDESLRTVALMRLEGHSNHEIAGKLDCGVRTVERKLNVIRNRWLEEGLT